MTLMTSRKQSNLVLTVLISIAFSVFNMSVHFSHKVFEYLYPYMRLPMVEFIFGMTFFWLTCLIWITYRNWRKAEETLRKLKVLSPRDQLTNLYDRRGFFTLAEHYLKIAQQEKKTVMFLYMDVKGLQWVNDAFGRFGGDQVLIDTANILKGTFRESDILARIGGDEFVALLPGIPQDESEEPVKRLQKHIREFNLERTCTFKLELSMSMVFYDYRHPLSVEDLLQQADQLIYKGRRQKSRGLPKLQYAMGEPLINSVS